MYSIEDGILTFRNPHLVEEIATFGFAFTALVMKFTIPEDNLFSPLIFVLLIAAMYYGIKVYVQHIHGSPLLISIDCERAELKYLGKTMVFDNDNLFEVDISVVRDQSKDPIDTSYAVVGWIAEEGEIKLSITASQIYTMELGYMKNEDLVAIHAFLTTIFGEPDVVEDEDLPATKTWIWDTKKH